MTPQEFGMWGLSAFVWVCTVFFTVWATSFVRNERQKLWLEEQMRLRFLEQVDKEELHIEFKPEE
ncbi:MAG: hypothetical protein CMK23_05400 [Porticoccaceae bacterium]|nr:hypothetical protein [Porticoccaceae bacterium]|tara:strand:- start:27646 stop:27840 length:195 start_codon:yes stop_codon:yes gene_type:complete